MISPVKIFSLYIQEAFFEKREKTSGSTERYYSFKIATENQPGFNFYYTEVFAFFFSARYQGKYIKNQTTARSGIKPMK